MSDRPSDGFTFDELREEYDWMSDFMGRMAERIRGNADVRSLAAYVGKLEAENAKLQNDAELLRAMLSQVQTEKRCYMTENAKLRELVADMWFWHYEGHIDSESQERQMLHIDAVIQRMRELGVEVNDG